jgi:hypothetical protein
MIRRWSPEEIEQLREMVKAGYTNKQIAERTGRSLRSVEKRLMFSEIYRVRVGPTIAQMKALRARYDAGETVTALAKETGMRKDRIRYLWHTMGIGVREVKPTVLTIRKVKETHARRVKGEKTGDLAREIGVNEFTLRAAWRRAKLGPVTRVSYRIDKTMILAAIKARSEGVKWDAIPAVIGSNKSVNAIRLAVWYHQKK